MWLQTITCNSSTTAAKKKYCRETGNMGRFRKGLGGNGGRHTGPAARHGAARSVLAVHVDELGTAAEGVDLGLVRCGNDTDIAERGEVIAQHHVEAVALAVGSIAHPVDAPHEDAGREHAGIARGLDDLALARLGIAGNVGDVGRARVAAVPLQVAEIVLPAHAARNARLAVGDGHDQRMVWAAEIDDAHDAAAADHAHLGRHAVGGATVDDEVVVDAHAYLVAHHAGGYQAVAVEFAEHAALGVGSVALGIGKCLAQGMVFLLETEVGVRKAAVDLAQLRKGYGVGIDAIDGGRHLIGAGKPHVSLVTVEADEQDHADRLQHKEKKKIVVPTQKVEKHLHGCGRYGKTSGKGGF